MKNGVIRTVIFWQAIIILTSGIIWAIKDDHDKWFERWTVGLILFSMYGIMKHLENPNNE